jgi:hypothetical protein
MSRRSLLLPIPLQSSRSPRESPIACAVMNNLLYEIFSGLRPLAVALALGADGNAIPIAMTEHA